MCLGVDYNVVIPPHSAYGEAGLENYIPGSAVLVVDIHSKKVWDPMDPKDVAHCDNQEEKTFEKCDSVSQTYFMKQY